MPKYELATTKSFDKKLKLFLKSRKELIKAVARTFSLLERNPFDSLLKTHKLGGSMKEFYASSVSFHYRIVFIIYKNTIILHNIGSHDEVYE